MLSALPQLATHEVKFQIGSSVPQANPLVDHASVTRNEGLSRA